jgi:DNA transformation protein
LGILANRHIELPFWEAINQAVAGASGIAPALCQLRRILLINLGPKSRQWLAEIGIYSIDDLRNAGSIPTYKILKERYPKKVSLNLLWGLEAAIREIDWRELSEADKELLKNRLR